MQRRSVAAFALVVLATLACRTAPVLNVEGAPVPPGLTQEQVHDALLSAVPRRGWIVQEDQPGLLTARLDRRDHSATVDIAYDTTSYRITHRESKNLRFDGTNIHKNYNGWIMNLNGDIQTELLRKRAAIP